MNTNSGPGDVTVDIPLTPVADRGQTGARKDSPVRVTAKETFHSASESSRPLNEKAGERSGLFHRRGMRKARNNSEARSAAESDDEEVTTLNHLGRLYNKILNFSIVTRYFVYVLPIGLLIAIPIIVGATAAQGAILGGVRIVWIFTWVEVIWLS
ncbi:hypothetical protein GP486_008735, partial [Trichoglossum hirsutum]